MHGNDMVPLYLALVDLARAFRPGCPSLCVGFCDVLPRLSSGSNGPNKMRLDAFMFVEIMHLRLLNFSRISYMIHELSN